MIAPRPRCPSDTEVQGSLGREGGREGIFRRAAEHGRFSVSDARTRQSLRLRGVSPGVRNGSSAIPSSFGTLVKCGVPLCCIALQAVLDRRGSGLGDGSALLNSAEQARTQGFRLSRRPKEEEFKVNVKAPAHLPAGHGSRRPDDPAFFRRAGRVDSGDLTTGSIATRPDSISRTGAKDIGCGHLDRFRPQRRGWAGALFGLGLCVMAGVCYRGHRAGTRTLAGVFCGWGFSSDARWPGRDCRGTLASLAGRWVRRPALRPGLPPERWYCGTARKARGDE